MKDNGLALLAFMVFVLGLLMFFIGVRSRGQAVFAELSK